MAITVDYDLEADCAYIKINNLPHSYTKEIDESLVIDYAEDGTIIGIEVVYPRIW